MRVNQLRRTTWLIAGLIVVCCLGEVLDVNAQEGVTLHTDPLQQKEEKQKTVGESTETPYIAQKPLDCETFAALMDNAVIEWFEIQGTYLVIIARQGKGEKTDTLNVTRLKDVEDYLKHYKTIKYVTAEGSPVTDSGQVELYVGGKLRATIPVERNAKAVCSGKVNPFL